MPWRRWLMVGIPLVALASVAAWAVNQHGLPKVAFGRPWWLLALVLLPALVWYSYRPLANLGPIRRWLALGLRCVLVAVVVLALADMRGVKEDERLTLMVAIDRSLSIPQEFVDEPKSGKTEAAPRLRDLRWDRLTQSFREASRRIPPGDRVGVISFARKPRLEFPAGDVPEVNLQNLSSIPDRNYTDIAAAIRLALASFPEGAARRLLLISDGNENRGDAVKEAGVARLNGVPIDVVPLKYQYKDEIMVDRIDAPTETQENKDVPIRVILRNFTNRVVHGTLTLTRSAGDQKHEHVEDRDLAPGLNVLQVKWPGRGITGGAYTYRAIYLPKNLAGDRPDNNEAWAPVLVRGEGRRILLIVPEKDSPTYQPLLQALSTGPAKTGRKKYQVDVWNPDQLPGEKDPRHFELSNYDSIVLYNIPADVVPRDQQEALRKNVRDLGCGLLMIGGKDSFGAGRWQAEPLEEALPVNTSLQALKVQPKKGLVLIMHASEMDMGNYWQKEVARLAIKNLGPQDEIGITYYAWGGGGLSGHVWHVPLQAVGPNRSTILKKLEEMQPGDMPEFDPSLKMAHQALTDEKKQIGPGARHIILVSDGDHGLVNDRSILGTLRAAQITLTTVGVTTHGPAAQEALRKISQQLGGRHYAVDDPQQLPSIYIKETRLINQSFLYEKPFTPDVYERGDPLREWTQPFPQLRGYVRTTAKDSKLVQILLRSPVPGDDLNPLLAQWQYGLGRVVAFTSDAGGTADSWAREWTENQKDLFIDFWSRVAEWSMRSVDDLGLTLESRYENGKLRATLIDNRDKEERARRPLGGLKVTVASSANPDSKEALLEPTSAGVYEGMIDAEASGSYTLTVSGMAGSKSGENKPVILARSAVAIPYSPEFAAVRSDEGLLAEIARITGGRVLDETTLASADLFSHADMPMARHFQPLWHWLLFIAACLLFLDVTTRRLAVDPNAIVAKLHSVWERWRGRARTEQADQYMERLRSRKAAVGEQLDRGRATQRYEPPPVPARTATQPAPVAVAPPRPAPTATAAAPKPQETDDFAARLMKAKQKAREQIEGEKRDEASPDA